MYMKRAILFVTIAVLWINIAGFGQGVKFGLIVRPQFASQNIENPTKNGDTAKFTHVAANFRFAAGMVLDMYMGENVAFELGALYNTKGSELKYQQKINFNPKKDTSITILRNLQYIEVPVALKFFTNDLAKGLRIYGLIGGGGNVLIAAKGGKDGTEADFYDKSSGETVPFKTFVQLLDVTLKVTAGIEFPLGGDTRLFFGIQYDRGLMNTYKPITDESDKLFNKYLTDMTVKNNCIGFEIGVKF